MALLSGENLLFWNLPYWVPNNQKFHVDLKTLSLPLRQNAPKKIKIKKRACQIQKPFFNFIVS
jgi:hypothetical protein